MVRPERRTRADLAAVALLVIAGLVGGLVLWLHSDVRATRSETAPRASAAPAPAEVPATLTEAWRAPSPATPKPVVAGPAAVTGEGNQVTGRDPATGQVRWSYARDIPLCTVGSEWGHAIAVYRKSHNCSEVTSLEGSTGKRGPQRDSDADFGTELLSDGRYVTATGHNMIETWRSDLVRTQQYGLPTALKNEDNNLKRPDCKYSSVAAGHGRVGVTEKCPKAADDRLTMIKAHPEDEEEPEEVFSTGVGSRDASVVMTNESRAAMVLRDRGELVIYDGKGTFAGQFPVRTGPPPARSSPGSTQNEPVTKGPRTYWFTGKDTVALDRNTMSPLWTVPDTLGSGTIFGGKLVLPVAGGFAVHDPNTGARERVIPVDRQGFQGTVRLNAVSNTLLEQRGNTVFALR